MSPRLRSRLMIVAAVACRDRLSRFRRHPGRVILLRPGEASLPTSPASYLGVYETGPPDTYQPVAEFVGAVGKQPNLVGYYSGWREPFQTPFAETVHAQGAVTIVQMDPTDASIKKIAAGGYDGYLHSYADSVRRFGQPVVIGFGHEMNAPWYSWGYGHDRSVDLRGRLAAHRDAVPRPGSRQRHLAVDAPGGRARHRADRLLVAGQPVRHLGRHRRLLLPPFRHLRQCLRQDDHRGADPHRQARAAVGDRYGTRVPARPRRSATCSTGCATTARSGSCGLTSGKTTGPTIRTGTSKTARRPRRRSGIAPRAWLWPGYD